MDGFTSRTELNLGKQSTEKLNNSSVLLFGLGGVGGYTFEALLRSGVGRIDVVDSDTFEESNLNRQILSELSTLGRYKTEVAKERAERINKNCRVEVFTLFADENTLNGFDFSKYDYVVDAIDSIPAKVIIAKKAEAENVPLISSMGTGNKLDPTAFKVNDVYKTKVCPLAKKMRAELKKAGVKKLKCVYSEEEPVASENNVIGSNSFVPATAALIMAGEVIKDLIK